MNRRYSQLKIRVKFEPNRFSADYLVKVYEQLQPVDSRIISKEGKENEEAGINAAIEGDAR